MRLILERLEADEAARAREGDGKAVYLGDMTDAEYDAYEREDVQGWGDFFKDVLSIGHKGHVKDIKDTLKDTHGQDREA